jgi:predicted ATPase
MGVASVSVLVGREAELERLDAFTASLSSGPAAAIVSGGAGIGKTAVWRVAVERAEAAGVRVLAARCSEVELPIGFGTLADLLERVLDEAGEELSGMQRAALAAAFGRAEAGSERPDWLVLAEPVRATLAALAARGRLLVALDDLHWLDPGSRRVLAWALRRLMEASLGLVATVRGEKPSPKASTHCRSTCSIG